jgi:ABC-type nickel/cobalt efflux system permease component RcnA
MFGLDDWIAHFSDGTTLALVIAVAVAVGLRHASDPDHLTAVTTLVATGKDRGGRTAARLGLSWGLGHAASLFAFGLPIIVFKTYLPEPVQAAAETSVGVMIALLALWLLVRWRRGLFHLHQDHGPAHAHGTRSRFRARTPLQAFGIGLVHGMGGSAGVGVLLLASIHDRGVAVAALGLFAVCTALSMAALSTGLGMTLAASPVRSSFSRLAPVLGGTSLAFGVWYALGALSLAPYYF